MSIAPRIHAHLHAYATQTKHDNHKINFVSEWTNRGNDTYSINVLYTPDEGEPTIIEYLVSCTEGRVYHLNLDSTEDKENEDLAA